MAPNLGNYLGGNSANKVKHCSHNTGPHQLRSDTPAVMSQYIVPPPVCVDPVAVADVRPGLSDSDHYGVYYMP